MGHVVVGVDGSEPSRAALAWAANYAHERDATLHVVNVYRVSDEPNPHDVGMVGGDSGVHFQEQTARLASDWREQHDQYARQQAEARVQHMVGELDSPSPDRITAVAVEGRRPAKALIEEAQGADLLVVGSRGRGGFSGLVLGSVSQQLAGYAPCPLLIVRHDDE